MVERSSSSPSSPSPLLYDLVIVGASFAGLVAAKTAAMRGLKVAVLDKKPEAGFKVASTGILVKEAAEEIDVPHSLTHRVFGVRLYGPNLTSMDLFSPGYFFLTTDTAALLRFLANEAMRGGAHILWRAPFLGAAHEGGVFRFAGMNIAARYIIGADGARSKVAQHFGLGRNTQFLSGVEVEFESEEGADPRFLHCFLDWRHAPGYLGWIAPGPRQLQVGLAASVGRRPKLANFLAHIAPVFDAGSARTVVRKAGRIPVGGMVKPWAADGVLLIGDAAGMVSPATGGGIRLAFQFGRRAGQAVADYLLHLGPRPEVALKWEVPAFLGRRELRWLLDRPIPNGLINALMGTAPLRWFASHVYFHRRGPKGFTFADFEARLAALGEEHPQKRLILE